MEPGSPGAAPLELKQGAPEAPAAGEAAGLAAAAVPAAEPALEPSADSPAAMEQQPQEEEQQQEVDIVNTMSRQLSRLSIPDSSTSARDAVPDSAGSGAALAGLEELPDLPSPARPNFQPTCEPSPELFERVAVGGAAAAAAPTSPPEGFYPRSKSVSPVQRKIKEMEVGGCWCRVFGG